MSDAVADVLDDAADLIEKEGWVQGRYGDLSIGFCVVGALRSVCDSTSLVYFWARAAICTYIGERPSIVDWNDAPERTKQEVLDTLRMLAKEQRDA